MKEIIMGLLGIVIVVFLVATMAELMEDFDEDWWRDD